MGSSLGFLDIVFTVFLYFGLWIILVCVNSVQLVIVKFREFFVVVISFLFVVRLCFLGGSGGLRWEFGVDGLSGTKLERSVHGDLNGAFSW